MDRVFWSVRLISACSIPPGIWRLTTLGHLLLDQARPSVEQLRRVSSPQRLTSLRLCHGGEELRAALPALTAPPSLAELRLDGNGLAALPELTFLTHLALLDLKRNR